MSLFEELIEYTDEDNKIVKTFKSKGVLCPLIFDDLKMKPEIREKLLEISDDFIESLGVDFFIHDVVLTGSLSNYNWSEYSDIDLHILIDFDDIDVNNDLLKQFFDSKKDVWNKNRNVFIKNFEIEVYVQDVNEPHISSGVYSVLNDEWVVEPSKDSPKIDDRKILTKGEEFAKKIDDLISKYETKDVENDVETLMKKIKSFRQSGLKGVGEYSYENLTFKLLRRNGYIGKLVKLKSRLKDKKLSLSEQ